MVRKKLLMQGMLGLVLCLTLFVQQANAAEEEKVYPITTLNIIYAETSPNTKEEGTKRGGLKAIFKRFDSVDDKVTAKAYKNKKADKKAIERGFAQMPSPMFNAILDKFKALNIPAAPVVYSNLRSKEQLEELRSKLTEAYPPLPERGEFVISLLPYQTIFTDSDQVVVWVGAVMYDIKHKQNKMLDYLTVEFGPDKKEFDKQDGDRFAAVLMNDLSKRGYLPEQAKENIIISDK